MRKTRLGRAIPVKIVETRWALEGGWRLAVYGDLGGVLQGSPWNWGRPALAALAQANPAAKVQGAGAAEGGGRLVGRGRAARAEEFGGRPVS